MVNWYKVLQDMRELKESLATMEGYELGLAIEENSKDQKKLKTITDAIHADYAGAIQHVELVTESASALDNFERSTEQKSEIGEALRNSLDREKHRLSEKLRELVSDAANNHEEKAKSASRFGCEEALSITTQTAHAVSITHALRGR